MTNKGTYYLAQNCLFHAFEVNPITGTIKWDKLWNVEIDFSIIDILNSKEIPDIIIKRLFFKE